MKNKTKLQWLKKLKPFWMVRDQAYNKFRKCEYELEKEMKKELGEDLEFFYGDMDMGCCGIGHSNYNKRKKFPLFHNEEIESGKLNDF